MWYKNVGTSFFRFVTIHAFDRQAGEQGRLAISCVTCSRTVERIPETLLIRIAG